MTQTPSCPPPLPEAEAEDGTEVNTKAENQTENKAGSKAGSKAENQAENPAENPDGPEAEADLELTPPAPALTPGQAFDALYAFAAPALVRQTYLLTGRRELARESVERAFQLAWQRWPEVAVDRDPAGWVRAAAYEYAMSPWHRLRLRHRAPEPPPAALDDRRIALRTTQPAARVPPHGAPLRRPRHRAAGDRGGDGGEHPRDGEWLLHAREVVAARVPELADPGELRLRLTELGSKESLRTAAKPVVVRSGSERRARRWTRAAIAFTVLLIGSTAFTLRTAPDHYEAPQAPAATISGVPPRSGPGPLSEEEQEIRVKLRSTFQNGPERLRPELR